MTRILISSTSLCSSKSLILFTFGCTLAVVLMTFQYEHQLLLFNSPRLMLTIPSLSLISICGLGAALVGLLYPMLMTSINQTSIIQSHDNTIQKSQICRSLVIFVGINQLCTKITFPSNLHFSSIIVILCIVFWWWFDGNIIDFIFSIMIAFVLTIVTVGLILAGALQYTYSDFYLKTCVPCLTFAGAILTIQITKLLTPTLPIEKEHLKTE